MNLRLLTNGNFAMATFLIAVLGAILYGSTALLPIFMQSLLRYPALNSGLAMTPRGIGSFLSMMVVGRVVKRVDNRLLMAGGFLGLGASTWLLTRLNLDIVPANISWPLVLSGFCMGFIFVPLTTLSVATLRQDQIYQATGLYSLLRNVGASIGISIMVALQLRAAQQHQVTLVGHVTPYDLAYQTQAANMAAVLRGRSPLPAFYRMVVGQATLLSFLDTFRWMALGSLACVPFAWFFRRGKGAPAADAAVGH